MSEPTTIDTAALRAEMERLKQTPDVKAYHHVKARLMGAAGKGTKKHRESKVKLDATKL